MKKLVAVVLGALIGSTAFAKTVRPTENKEFKQVIVKLTDESKQSGGTGVIYSSSETGSIILTNAHVCDGATLALTEKGDLVIEAKLKSKYHDLCAVRVKADLGIDTQVEEEIAEFGEDVVVAGHPFLMPLTVTKGHLSDHLIIQMIAEIVPCTEKDFEQYPLECLFLGGLPVVKSLNTRTISATIAPGNSGSPVWNDSGRIVGFVFAGQGRSLSYGIIVPQEYVLSFLANEVPTGKWESVSTARKLDAQQQSTSIKLPNNIRTVNDLVLPAVIDPKYDNLIQSLNNCKGDLRQCLSQLNLL